MPNTSMTQSQKRFQESLGSLFKAAADSSSKNSVIFIKSSSDIGVIRNGGRNGAKYAPQSFLSVFKKMTQHPLMKAQTFSECEVSDEVQEKKSFEQAQLLEADKIKNVVNKNPGAIICHLGGGHDHIFPLLKSYNLSKRIVVINLDAHADTRNDDEFHSGNPFRKFAESFDGEFFLFQIGLHPFTNSQSTLSPLKKGKMNVLWRNELNEKEKYKAFFQSVKDVVDENTVFIFSIDADALEASAAPGVSAVNGHGLSREELIFCWENYREICRQSPVIGIYEINPVYDDLGMITVRTLSAFLYQTFF